MNFSDTIAAIATPMGEGGIGIVRISGERALAIAEGVLRTAGGKRFSAVDDHRVYYGMALDPKSGQPLDEVLFFYLKKPHSFTAEDVVEIQAHGGTLSLSKILNSCLHQGARLAEPGEFTMRAFMNGRIDLVQAESIIDLIRAKSDKGHELALAQLTGKMTRKIYQLEAEVYELLIWMEAILDFPEDGIPEPERDRRLEQTVAWIEELRAMEKTVTEGQKIREGIRIALAGRPNVGKSSLLNAMIEEEKAIVTEIPGTTRDVIEVQFQLQGVPILLTDTAGLRDTDNPIEKIGIEKAKQAFESAQLILAVLDGSQPLDEADRFLLEQLDLTKTIIVLNKSDLSPYLTREDLISYGVNRVVATSALTGEGLKQLEQFVIQGVGLGELRIDDRPMLSRVRHKQAIFAATEALENFRTGLSAGRSEDLLAIDLRACLAALGEITGKNVDEHVLEGIFANFCIGK